MGAEPARQGKSEESQEVVGEEPAGWPEASHASQFSFGVAGVSNPVKTSYFFSCSMSDTYL